LLNWLERETGLVSAWQRFWAQPLPATVGWGHIFGALTLLCLAILFVTGGAMMFYYSPTPDQAYPSVQYMERFLPFGKFIRALHYWAARLIVPLIIIHLVRAFLWGAYKKPRQMIWVMGVLLLLCVIGFGLTGYALPWDQKGYWGTAVRLKIAEGIPLIGHAIANFLKGGEQIGAVTLMRFYVLHVFVLPILTFLVTAWHIRQVHHLGVAPAWVRVGDEDAVPKTQRLHPDHTFRIAIGAIIFTALLLWFAARYPAPLEPRANPLDTAYKPHPDFYVLWLHELLKLFPPDWEFVGSFVLPTVLVLLLIAVPFLDKSPERHPLKRLPAITTGLTILFAIIALNIKGMEALPKPENLSPLERRGRELFVELRCYSCHGINGGGGPVGPDLGLGGKRDPKKVEAILRNPGAFNAHTVMPAYHLPPDDMKALVAYIVSLGPHSRMPPIPPVEPEKPPSHFEDNWLITHKFEVRKDPQSCQSCHKPFFCQACHQQRRPSSHLRPDWLKFHFGNAADELRTCDICHTPDYCADCHRLTRHDTAWLRQHGATLTKFGETKRFGAMTLHQLCYQCHTRQSCDECHQGALPESHKVPDFLQRHGELAKSGDKTMATANRQANAQTCATCHTQAFCTNCHMGAKPKSHEQPNFVAQGIRGAGRGKSGHALEALRKGVQSCATCHEQKFCANCHGMPMPHPQGFVRTHIQEARRNLALCQRCHDWGEQSCRQCHAKRPPSHTADFRETHPQRLADGGASCQVCHGRNACADCHRLPMPHPDNFLHAHGELAKGQQGNERQRVQNLHRQLCAHCHTIAYCRKCHLLGNP
jgi:ubiquinol-cytochrome c reductase cytochrome b subunit